MKTILLADGHDATVNANFGPLLVNDTDGMWFQVDASDASIGGTVQVQASFDGSKWVDAGSGMTITAGASAGEDITTPSKFFRCVYTNTGGTGNITIGVNIKERYQM